jgi:hypothetical protein
MSISERLIETAGNYHREARRCARVRANLPEWRAYSHRSRQLARSAAKQRETAASVAKSKEWTPPA